MRRASDDIIALYRRHWRAWADARGERLVEREWLDQFLQLLPAPATVLDLGCGSGLPIGRYLADRGVSVTGVDSAPEMTALFARNLPGHATRVSDMRGLDLGQRFNGLIAWDSVFHLSHDHQRAMFGAFAAHALPGAALMFTSGPAFGEAIGALEGEPLYHASLDPEEYRDLLKRRGFEAVAHVREDPTCGGRTVWLAQACEAEPSAECER